MRSRKRTPGRRVAMRPCGSCGGRGDLGPYVRGGPCVTCRGTGRRPDRGGLRALVGTAPPGPLFTETTAVGGTLDAEQFMDAIVKVTRDSGYRGRA